MYDNFDILAKKLLLDNQEQLIDRMELNSRIQTKLKYVKDNFPSIFSEPLINKNIEVFLDDFLDTYPNIPKDNPLLTGILWRWSALDYLNQLSFELESLVERGEDTPYILEYDPQEAYRDFVRSKT